MKHREQRRIDQGGAPEISAATGRPEWAGRVPRHKIAQLYRTDALGIVDQELIAEVGFALLARCESILIATEANRGQAMCPVCRSLLARRGKGEERVECESCGWSLPWSEYQASFRRKQLSAGGIEDFLREFVEKYPKAPSPRHRMILIDQLIHRYHWEMIQDPGRPGGSNLIGGTVTEIVAFLNALTYSEQSTPGLRETYNRWRKQGRRVLRKLEKSGALPGPETTPAEDSEGE